MIASILPAHPILISNLSVAEVDELAGFLRAQFPAHNALPTAEYCRWRYLRNPLGESIEDCLVARSDDKIVAFLGAISDRVWDGTEWRDCRWLVNLVVAHEQRGGLLALRLFQTMMQRQDLLLATGAGAHMRPLYSSLNWRQLPVGNTYYHIRRPSALLRLARDKDRTTGFDLGPILWPADAALTRLPHRRSDAAQLTELSQAKEELDDFFMQWGTSLGTTTWRDARLLRWKCERSAVQLYTVRSRETNQLTGYALVKPMCRPRIASWLEVVDLCIASAEAVPALLRATLGLARERDVDFVRLRCSSQAVTQHLRRPYWWRKTMPISDDVFVYCRHEQVLRQITTGPWFFTSLMSDRADYGRDEGDEG